MRKIFVILTLCFAFAVSGISQDVSGKWKGTAESPQGTFELEFNFKAEGTALTGNVTSSFGEIELVNGKIDGKMMAFDVSIQEYNIHNQGEIISEDEIKLTTDMAEMTIKRVKE